MKNIVAVIIAIVLILGIVSLGVATDSKRTGCHKGDKALDKIVVKKRH